MHIYMVLVSVHLRVLSGNQLKHEKQNLGHPSSIGCMKSFENVLLVNGITDTSVQKVTQKIAFLTHP